MAYQSPLTSARRFLADHKDIGMLTFDSKMTAYTDDRTSERPASVNGIPVEYRPLALTIAKEVISEFKDGEPKPGNLIGFSTGDHKIIFYVMPGAPMPKGLPAKRHGFSLSYDFCPPQKVLEERPN